MVARGWIVPLPPWALAVPRTALMTARELVRLGTGTVALGWVLPAGPWALAGPRVKAMRAREDARRGTGTVARGCTVPFEGTTAGTMLDAKPPQTAETGWRRVTEPPGEGLAAATVPPRYRRMMRPVVREMTCVPDTGGTEARYSGAGVASRSIQ